MTKIKMKLRHPIKSFGKEVTELEFREPTAADMIHCKSPYKYVTGGDETEDGIEPLNGAIARYVCTLSGITSGAVKTMHAQDFMEAGQIVMGFFVEEATKSPSSDGSTSTTTSPASGE